MKDLCWATCYRPCQKFLSIALYLRLFLPTCPSFSSPQGSDLHCGLAALAASSRLLPVSPHRRFSPHISCMSDMSLAVLRTCTSSGPGRGHRRAKALRRLVFPRNIRGQCTFLKCRRGRVVGDEVRNASQVAAEEKELPWLIQTCF